MKKLIVDFKMLYFVLFILAFLIVGEIVGSKIREFAWFMILLCSFCIVSFIFRKKDPYFKAEFLISYFGLFTCLLVFNIILIATGDYEFLSTRIISIILIFLCVIYPFSPSWLVRKTHEPG